MSPATVVYHYQSWELSDLNIDPTQVHLVWPEQLAAAQASQSTAFPTPQAAASSTRQATGLAMPMADNASALTLSAQSSTLLGTMSVSAPPTIANPATPDLFEASGNAGQYTYSYPISVAPGPGGFAPQLALGYSSQSTNERYNRIAPAGSEGDGWSLSLGSISMATYPSTSMGGERTYDSLY